MSAVTHTTMLLEEQNHQVADSRDAACPALELSGVRFTRSSGADVSDEIDLSLRAGEGLAIVGAPGVGKSVLARVIAGVVPSCGGEMRLRGEYLAPAFALRTPEERRAVQLVTGDPARGLNPALTIRSQLRRATRRAEPDIGQFVLTKQVRRLLDQVDLEPRVLDEWPRTLSPEQTVRAALARALAHRPEVVICEDPTAGLSETGRHRVLEMLGRVRELGVALILVTNDSLAARYTCERLLHLHPSRTHLLTAAAFLPGDPGLCPVDPAEAEAASA